MNNEVSNALIASYPDAINFKETESYKSFYDALKRFLCVDSFEQRDVFLHDKQAEESYLFDFKQDDKQSPICFQRSYARTNDVSVVTSNRYTNVYVVENIQLEEGTVATPYEPYQEDKLTILSPVQLEKVGDVADRIIEKDGVWGVEKNVETIVLDGSEGWIKNPETETHFKAYANNILPTLKTTNILSNSDDSGVSAAGLFTAPNILPNILPPPIS